MFFTVQYLRLSWTVVFRWRALFTLIARYTRVMFTNRLIATWLIYMTVTANVFTNYCGLELNARRFPRSRARHILEKNLIHLFKCFCVLITVKQSFSLILCHFCLCVHLIITQSFFYESGIFNYIRNYN